MANCLIRLWSIAIAVSLSCGPLWAGAWLHEAGQGFTSASLRQRAGFTEIGHFTSYGLTPDVTVGLDLNDTNTGVAHVLGFVRFPIRQLQDHRRVAVEFGLGANVSPSQGWGLLHRITLSLGQTLQFKSLSGWASVDVSREFRDNGTSAAWKLDTTIGLGHGINVWGISTYEAAPILQVEVYKADAADLSYTVLPALRLNLRNRRTLVAGISYQAQRSSRQQRRGEFGLRLELWQRF